MADHLLPMPVPRAPMQPGLVTFPVWRERYAYFVDCVADNLRAVLDGTPGVAFDWAGMREDLEAYLYSTGHSRFKSFELLSGPRPHRHPRFRKM